MTMSKIFGALLLIVAGTGTAVAHKAPDAVAISADHAASRPAGRTIFSTNAEWHGPHDDYRERDRHHDRRHYRGHVPAGGYGYWGPGGYAYSEESRDMFGYFATGGEVSLVEGEAYYDYDRSYPYDWFRDAGPESAEAATGQVGYRCQTSLVENGPGGGKSPVRVCRR